MTQQPITPDQSRALAILATDPDARRAVIDVIDAGGSWDDIPPAPRAEATRLFEQQYRRAMQEPTPFPSP